MVRPSWICTPATTTPVPTTKGMPEVKAKSAGAQRGRRPPAQQQVVRTSRGTIAQQPYRIGNAAGLDRVQLDEGALEELQDLKAAKGTLEARHA